MSSQSLRYQRHLTDCSSEGLEVLKRQDKLGIEGPKLLYPTMPGACNPRDEKIA